MSNIVKNDHYKINPSFNGSEVSIVKAHNSRLIRDCEESEIGLKVTNSIAKAVVALSSKLSVEDIQELINSVIDYVVIRCYLYKIDEIEIAIKLGSYGEFKKDGEVLYLSVANVISWIKSYKLVKAETMKKQFSYDEKQKAKEEEEKKNKMANYEFYRDLGLNVSKATRETCKIGFVYFEFLYDKIGIIKLTKEQRQQYRKEAEIQVRKELREKKVNLFKIGEDNMFNMVRKKQRELAFFDWVEDNRDFGIKELIDSKVSVVVDLEKLKAEFYG